MQKTPNDGEITLPAYLEAVLKNMGDSLYRPPRGGDAIGSAPCLAARVAEMDFSAPGDDGK